MGMYYGWGYVLDDVGLLYLLYVWYDEHVKQKNEKNVLVER